MASDMTQWVNPLQGTDSTHSHSHGNTLPLVGMPFAMTSWSLQTSEDRWFFHPSAPKLQGIRATRQPSPWIGDYGHFTLMPQVGERLLAANRRASSYRLSDATILPHWMRVKLLRYETTVEIAATERCAILVVHFPTGTSPKRLILDTFPGESRVEIDAANGCVRGHTRAHSAGDPKGFAGHFILKFDCPLNPDDTGLFADGRVFAGQCAGTGDRIGAFAGVLPRDGSPVVVRIATSFISAEQCALNMEQELGGRAFAQVRDEAAAAWNRRLNGVEIEGCTDEQRRTFTSCLYRASLFPRRVHETGPDGARVHYSPYDGAVHPGDFCTDNGFWDTHRTVYPLFSLLWPDQFAEFLRGLVAHYREGGWLPRWPSPGETGGMIGTHIDAIIADACMKGIRDFDLETAFEGMWKHANQRAPGGRGRAGIEEYLRLGYVPVEGAYHCVSRTLDYAYDDFCVGQVAAALGRTQQRDELWRRAQGYRAIYDASSGFMRARHADGRWAEPFDPFAWGGPYVEGSAWQCSWAVPHDPAGLAELLGGDDAMVRKFEEMLALPPIFRADEYREEIHEMTEMALADFGQYAHSNQPVHHVLYLFAAAGRPDLTQHWVRRVMDRMYGPGPDGFPGDEDNGEMASWFVLSSLGLFPLCPGHPSYVLGSPLFRNAVIHGESGNDIVIEAPRNSPENVYVSGVSWNGRPLSRVFMLHEELARGGTLRFEMTDKPAWTSVDNPADRPFSLSRHGLSAAPTPQS